MGSIRRHVTTGIAGLLLVGGLSYAGARAASAPEAGVVLTQASEQPAAPAAPAGHRAQLRRPIRGELVVPGREDGTFQKVRIDRGVVDHVAGTTVVIKEEDGTTVNIPTTADTRIGRDGQMAAVGDLKKGDHAFAVRVDDGSGLVTKGIRAISPEKWTEFQQRRDKCRSDPASCPRPGRGQPAA